MNRELIEALVAAFIGLEEAHDDDVNPDWVVKILEGMCEPLLRLSDADRDLFKAQLRELAAELDDDPFYEPWRRYYTELPAIIGLDD